MQQLMRVKKLIFETKRLLSCSEDLTINKMRYSPAWSFLST